MPQSACAPRTAQKRGSGPFEQEAGADQRQAGDDREAPRVEVGDHAGGRFEEEYGHLQDGADKHQLQGIQSYRLDLVDKVDGEGQRVEERAATADDKIDSGRVMLAQGDSGPFAGGAAAPGEGQRAFGGQCVGRGRSTRAGALRQTGRRGVACLHRSASRQAPLWAPKTVRLPLLPPGPDGVHGCPAAQDPATDEAMQTREAEREGFEPSRAFTLRAFQARALGPDYATSPNWKGRPVSRLRATLSESRISIAKRR